MRRWLLLLALLLMPISHPCAMEWHHATLENGLKVMILENRQVPQVNISTVVQVGAKNESDFFDGATHLLEHLILFRGTEKMTGEEVGDAMTKHGAYFNGYTNSDWTDFVISLPKENLEFALSIHADMLFRSNFPAEALDGERQAVLEEINISEDSPFGTAYREARCMLFGNHPYSKNVLGTKERVSNVPRDSVYAYYKRYYAPNNMTMVIVGDVDAGKTMDRVKAHFGDFPPGTRATDNYQTPPPMTRIIEKGIQKDVGQAYMIMADIGPMADSPDQHPLDVMATLLGSGDSCRLYKKLKDELGLVYTIGYSFQTSKYEGMLYTSATLDPANIDAVEGETIKVFLDVIENGFTERELQKAKNIILTNYYQYMEQGLSIADNYAQYDSFVGWEFQEEYPDKIEKVTLAELNATARKYLNTDVYVKTTVVPK
jgi:zinc protease